MPAGLDDQKPCWVLTAALHAVPVLEITRWDVICRYRMEAWVDLARRVATHIKEGDRVQVCEQHWF